MIFWQDFVSSRKLESLVSQEKLFLGDSDTVLGLFAPATLGGYISLNKLKGRSEKAYIVLINSKKDIKKYAESFKNTQIEKILTACWPGPLTVIFKARMGLPEFLQKQSTIALRVPGHQELRNLLAITGPLFSTSANKSGCPVPETLESVDQEILTMCELIVCNKHSLATITPSTIVDFSDPEEGKELKIIREGAISTIDLQNLWNS